MVSLPAAVPVVEYRPSLPLPVMAGEAGAHAQVTREVRADHHDARFDQHLAHGDIERRDQRADAGDAVGRVLDQQRVGARVDGDAATRRQQ